MSDRRNTNDAVGNSSDSDDDDVPEELKRDFVDEETGETNSMNAKFVFHSMLLLL